MVTKQLRQKKQYGGKKDKNIEIFSCLDDVNPPFKTLFGFQKPRISTHLGTH
jgi:hypothetical protein